MVYTFRRDRKGPAPCQEIDPGCLIHLFGNIHGLIEVFPYGDQAVV